MIFSKKKNKAPIKEEEVVVNDPMKELGGAANRLWSALNAIDEAGMYYESAIFAASDKDIAKYDKTVSIARREMKTAQFCVNEVFTTLLEKLS